MDINAYFENMFNKISFKINKLFNCNMQKI